MERLTFAGVHGYGSRRCNPNGRRAGKQGQAPVWAKGIFAGILLAGMGLSPISGFLPTAEAGNWDIEVDITSDLDPIPPISVKFTANLADEGDSSASFSIQKNKLILYFDVHLHPGNDAEMSLSVWGRVTEEGEHKGCFLNLEMSQGSTPVDETEKGFHAFDIFDQDALRVCPGELNAVALLTSFTAVERIGKECKATAEPFIAGISPSSVPAPANPGEFINGTFEIFGMNFKGAQVFTDGPLVLVGDPFVDKTGSLVTIGFIIGCCVPRDEWIGRTFNIFVLTRCGEVTVPVLVESE